MELLDLNIKDIDNNWSINDAIRELVANAIDEHILTNITNDIKITYNSQTKTLIISDEGRGIKNLHFIENANKEKLNHPNVFGKYGVNLKNAIAVLVNNHVNVTIKSDFGIYTPLITNKQGVTEQIPTIHIQRENNFNEQKGTIISLSPINQQQADQASNLLVLHQQGKWINTIANHPNDSALVNDLNQQIIDLKTQLKTTNNDSMKLASLHNELLVLQGKLSDKTSELDAMHQELTNTSNQLSKMAQQLTDSVHDSNVLKSELNTTKTENTKLKESLVKINAEYNAIDDLLKDPSVIVDEVCPDCGSNLVMRENHKNHSKFLGCLNYPKCTYIKHIPQPQPVSLKTKVQKLQTENKSLHEQLVKQKNQFQSDLEDAKQALNKQYELRINDWYKNISEQTNKTISELQTKLQSKLDQNDADLVNKTTEIVQLKQMLAKLNIEKNELTSLLYDEQIKVANTNNELNTKTHLLKEINTKLEGQTKQVNELTSANANLIKQLNNLQTENNTLKTKLTPPSSKQTSTNLLTDPNELLKTLAILIPSTKKITLNADLTNFVKVHVIYLAFNNKLYPVTNWLQVINNLIKVLYATYQGKLIEYLWNCKEGEIVNNLIITEKNQSSLVFKNNDQTQVTNQENITFKIADTIYRLVIQYNQANMLELIKYIVNKLNISLDSIYFIGY